MAEIDTFKINNKGSAVLEATLIMPIFIFAMLAIYQMGQCKLAESALYEAAAETVEYMAEYAYVGDLNLLIPELKFSEYADDKVRIERYIKGGVNGVNFFGTVMLDEDNYVILKVNYRVCVPLPFFSELSESKTITIRQRAYVGDINNSKDKNANKDEQYVYITDNRDVYHSSRSCSHLMLTIQVSDKDTASLNGYSKCEFCGDDSGGVVYVTDYGRRYHFDIRCSGLKRTIYRVKLTELNGMRGCSRCVE